MITAPSLLLQDACVNNKTHSVANTFKLNLEQRITAGNIKRIKGIDCRQKTFANKCFYSLKMNMLKVAFLSRG